MGPRGWDFGEVFGGAFGPGMWVGFAGFPGRRRQQIFESGDVKYVILGLLREKPRHGYEIIKELESKARGWYTPSPGTIYPTLQMLEDEGYVRAVETEGRRVYHITAEGLRFLDEHRGELDEIMDRVRDVLRNFAGGSNGELHRAFARVASLTYEKAWRYRSDPEYVRRIAQILTRAAEEIEGTSPTRQ